MHTHFGFIPIQVNTVTNCITSIFNINPIIIGITIGVLTAFVIFGGVKKIASVSSKIVPIMAGIYFFMCLYIILKNGEALLQIFVNIIDSAFNIKTFGIGTLSTLIIGMQKGIFSSELGLGTGSIASAISDVSPASSGIVQTFGIHFENLFIATITTIVICMSNYQGLILNDPNGVEITLFAFKEHLGNLGTVLIMLIISMFGIATVFTGYYYGESSLKFIKKAGKFDMFFLKIITLTSLVVSSVVASKTIWWVTDCLVGILAIINIYAIYKLKNIVIEEYNINKRKNYN